VYEGSWQILGWPKIAAIITTEIGHCCANGIVPATQRILRDHKERQNGILLEHR
jgi:hypothetical protein